MKSIKTLKKLNSLIMIIALAFSLTACYNNNSNYSNYKNDSSDKVEKLTMLNIIDYIENGEDKVNFKTQDITNRKSATNEENNIITGEIVEAYEFSCRQAIIEVYQFKTEDEAYKTFNNIYYTIKEAAGIELSHTQQRTFEAYYNTDTTSHREIVISGNIVITAIGDKEPIMNFTKNFGICGIQSKNNN